MSKNKIEGMNPNVDCTTEGLHVGQVCDYKEGLPTVILQVEILGIEEENKGHRIIFKILKSPTDPKAVGQTSSIWNAGIEEGEQGYYYGGMGRFSDKGTHVREE